MTPPRKIEIRATINGLGIAAPLLVVQAEPGEDVDEKFVDALRRLALAIERGPTWAALFAAIERDR